jgi:hypothetical protein
MNRKVLRYVVQRIGSLSLKWSECNFELFSNIKLIVLKNTLRYSLYGTTNEKFLSCLVRPRKKKIAKLVMATDATLYRVRKPRTIYSNFFEPKNFKLSMYILRTKCIFQFCMESIWRNGKKILCI